MPTSPGRQYRLDRASAGLDQPWRPDPTIVASTSARCSTTAWLRTSPAWTSRSSSRRLTATWCGPRAGSGTPAASTSPPARPASTSGRARCSRCSPAASSSTRRSASDTSAVADAGASFPLYPSKSALAQAQFTEKIPFLVYFDGSVRGLSPGAPVEFRGITVGVVTSVDLEFDPATAKIRIPVTHRDRAATTAAERFHEG